MVVHAALLHRLDVVNTWNWHLYSFQLPLISGGVRDGLLVRFIQSDGDEKWGEVAPLPGRSRETLSEALAQLLQLLNTGKTTEEELFPSVQFGLESALSPLLQATAPLYALLSGSDPDTVLRQADIAAEQGYTIVKVKVSSFSRDVGRRIIDRLKSRFRIRVDCNSAFSFDDALALFSPFDPSIFDYIEDPTHELDRLPEFPYPFALDETISKYRSLPLHSYRNLYGFILKPTILGGEKKCAPYIEFAQKHQLKVVFSPAFESGLGLLQILFLAKKFNLVSDSIGLDTHRYLKQDILSPAVNFNTPLLTIAQAPRINLQLLTEIAHGKCELPSL